MNQTDLANELDSLKAAILADMQADQAAVDALEQNVADLKAQLAAGQDTSGTIAQIEAIKALIKPVAPSTAPVPAPSTDPTIPPGETPVPTNASATATGTAAS